MRRIFFDGERVLGAIKTVPEDFVVEEIADSPPDGLGHHILLWVEKKSMDTKELVDAIGRHLNIPSVEIGVAGQKDRQAVTKQWVSVPAYAYKGPIYNNLEDIGQDGLLHSSLEMKQSGSEDQSQQGPFPQGERWLVLGAYAHSSKLRTGRLLGNRFQIRIRGAASHLEEVSTCLQKLSSFGVPNYFGQQRFGRYNDNATRGMEILFGKRIERKRFKRRIYLSAIQSELFNEWLDLRIDKGLLNIPIMGDWLRIRDPNEPAISSRNTNFLQVVDVETYKEGVKRGQLDPMGPIFGIHMEPAQHEAGELEEQVLESKGIVFDDFYMVDRDAPGSRRPARAWLENAQAKIEEDDLLLSFALEKGAYATVVLEQLGLGA